MPKACSVIKNALKGYSITVSSHTACPMQARGMHANVCALVCILINICTISCMLYSPSKEQPEPDYCLKMTLKSLSPSAFSCDCRYEREKDEGSNSRLPSDYTTKAILTRVS